jgi:hypothetical protein
MKERLTITVQRKHLKRFGITTYNARVCCKLGSKTLWSETTMCERLTKTDAQSDGEQLLANIKTRNIV